MSKPVRYDVAKQIAVITIDKPPVNALSLAVWEGLDPAVGRAMQNPAADAIVLIGTGSTFIAGADIRVFETLKTREQSVERSAGVHALLQRLEDCSKPLAAAIHGNALGGGLEVARACHYRVAARGARIGQPEVLLGIIPGADGTQCSPRLSGAALALEMCTEGKPISAERALASGVIDQIVKGNVRDGAIAFARERAAPGDIRKTREVSDKVGDTAAGLAACDRVRTSLGRTAKGLAAPYAAVSAIATGLQQGFDAGSLRERELCADCVVSTESKALRHLFFAEREAAKSLGWARTYPCGPSRAPQLSVPAQWAAALP